MIQNRISYRFVSRSAGMATTAIDTNFKKTHIFNDFA